ncbi:uncharacterized protein LOC106176225 isoform X2 [Lingula anatina]|nr:uncharacterized protein LOC106176225 isoform X2 [Lingula anatina]|eukprot:XP_013413970.1 uncharacterized protein LOC106176225 isoform X2 [Lingula anatina]
MTRNFGPDLEVDARLEREGVRCKKCPWNGLLVQWGDHRCCEGHRPQSSSNNVDVVGELYGTLSSGDQVLSEEEEEMMNILLTAGIVTGDDLHSPNGQRRPVPELREILQAAMRRRYRHLPPLLHRPGLRRLILLSTRPHNRRAPFPEQGPSNGGAHGDSLTTEESEILDALLTSGVLTSEDLAVAESQNISRKQLLRRFIKEQQQAYTCATPHRERRRHRHPLLLIFGPGAAHAGLRRQFVPTDNLDDEVAPHHFVRLTGHRFPDELVAPHHHHTDHEFPLNGASSALLGLNGNQRGHVGLDMNNTEEESEESDPALPADGCSIT